MKYQKIIAQMTLAQKCAILSGADVWHTRAFEKLGIPAIALSDGPSGLRKQAGEGDHLGLNASTLATCMPSSSAVASSWSEEVARSVGSVIGQEAAAQDVQVLLGPGLNTKRSPLCGRNFEYCYVVPSCQVQNWRKATRQERKFSRHLERARETDSRHWPLCYTRIGYRRSMVRREF